MGADKANLPFGDETLLERVVRILAPEVSELWLVARERQLVPRMEVAGVASSGREDSWTSPVFGWSPRTICASVTRSSSASATATRPRTTEACSRWQGWIPRSRVCLR